MTVKTQAEADLAFMKSLVEGRGGDGLSAFGRIYLIAGLVYGAQVLIYVWQEATQTLFAPLGQLVFAWAPTVVFVAYLAWELWRTRGRPQGGIAWRAVGAGFAGAGMANLALVVLFGALARQEQSMTFWLLHPAVVFVIQGAAWFTAGMLRKQAWMFAVSLGWFVAGVAMGLTMGTPAYLVWLAVGLFGLMAAPGAVMMRLAKKAA